jgi:SSS family solute:Na+ symporter
MFWSRATGHGAFFGLLGGTFAAVLFHGMAITQGLAPGIVKGGWLSPTFVFRSEMGQNFWMAIVAWTSCFVLTILVSLLTKRTKSNEDLVGLVYSLTPKPKSGEEPWFLRPATIGLIVLAATLILNIIFW